MKRIAASASALLMIAFIAAGCAHVGRHGWVALIDADKGFENWTPSGSDANWRAADGAIQADKATQKGSSTLVSKKSFKDFELYTEFWAADDTKTR